MRKVAVGKGVLLTYEYCKYLRLQRTRTNELKRKVDAKANDHRLRKLPKLSEWGCWGKSVGGDSVPVDGRQRGAFVPMSKNVATL